MRFAALLAFLVVGLAQTSWARGDEDPNVEEKTFAPLGTSKVALIKSKDNHDTPFYIGQVTNQNYFVHGKRLLAVSSMGTFQYTAVDSWPGRINVDVYSLQQAANAQTVGLAFDPSLPVTIASEPILSMSGDSVQLLRDNKWEFISKLPNVEPQPDHPATLAKSNYWVCCTAEGGEQYYNLTTGEQIASHTWDDENIEKNNTIPLMHNGQWLLVSYALETPKPTDQTLTLHISSITEKQKDERTIRVPLPKPYSELCTRAYDSTIGNLGDVCNLHVALDDIIVRKEAVDVLPIYNLSPIRINFLSTTPSGQNVTYPLASFIPDAKGKIIYVESSPDTRRARPVSTISR